jgi:hypothetical protein
VTGPLGLPADSQRCGAAVVEVLRDGDDVILHVEPERGGVIRLRLSQDARKALAARLTT